MNGVSFGENAEWKANQMPSVDSKMFSLIVAVAEFNKNTCECDCEGYDTGITIDDMYEAYLQLKDVIAEETSREANE